MNRVARDQVPTEVATTLPPSAEAARRYTIQLQPRPHVTFDDGVVDNEHLGRRRSKKCCVFHRKKDFGESSSESSDEDSDGADDPGRGTDRCRRQHDCKRTISRRTRPKKRLPSPSSSNDDDEEKTRAPIKQEED
uniref:Type 1 phosphatases regulator n=1 Tax=Peronospora matthiolae TaxID=2874970 RepID=A0AAV1UJB3_9STRA